MSKTVYYTHLEVSPSIDDPRRLVYRAARDAPQPPADLVKLRAEYLEIERVTAVLFEDDVETRKNLFASIHAAAHRAFIGEEYSLDDGRTNLREVQDIITDAAYAVRKRLFKSYNRYFLFFGIVPLLIGAVGFRSNGFGLVSTSDPIFSWAVASFWLVAGSTIAVWAEFVFRTRGGLKFEQLLEINPGRWNPEQRVVITVVTAFIFAFLLANKFLVLGLGNVLLNDFLREPSLALAIGGVTGFGLAAVMDTIFRLHLQSHS